MHETCMTKENSKKIFDWVDKAAVKNRTQTRKDEGSIPCRRKRA